MKSVFVLHAYTVNEAVTANVIRAAIKIKVPPFVKASSQTAHEPATTNEKLIVNIVKAI